MKIKAFGVLEMDAHQFGGFLLGAADQRVHDVQVLLQPFQQAFIIRHLPIFEQLAQPVMLHDAGQEERIAAAGGDSFVKARIHLEGNTPSALAGGQGEQAQMLVPAAADEVPAQAEGGQQRDLRLDRQPVGIARLVGFLGQQERVEFPGTLFGLTDDVLF